MFLSFIIMTQYLPEEIGAMICPSSAVASISARYFSLLRAMSAAIAALARTDNSVWHLSMLLTSRHYAMFSFAGEAHMLRGIVY